MPNQNSMSGPISNMISSKVSEKSQSKKGSIVIQSNVSNEDPVNSNYMLSPKDQMAIIQGVKTY